MQELKNKDAAVVVFSGGQDSTTCLFWALKRYKKVIALSFDYHQKHVKELECAKKICRDHEVEHHIMDMSLLNQLAPNSLTRVDIKVDEAHQKREHQTASLTEEIFSFFPTLQYLQNREASQTLLPAYPRATSPATQTAVICSLSL